MNQLKCTNCGQEIEVSEAFKHQIEERILSELKAQHSKDLEVLKKETEEKFRKKVEEEMEMKLRDGQEEALELKKRNKELTDQLLEMNKTLRELKQNDEKRALEFQKQLDLASEKIRNETVKIEEEKSTFKIAELQKKLTDTQKSLEDAQRKSMQGSQQLQGEVLELDLESKLTNTFPNDEIVPVGKGVGGGDIIQKVRNNYAQLAGVILWETKRAKWSPSWLPKLREDARNVDASMIVLVCEELPKEIVNFSMQNGVLVTSYSFALPLAQILRLQLMQLARAKTTAANKDEKLESMYAYLQSETFRHRFEAYVEGILGMQEDLETEKRSMQRVWKKREIQISRTFDNLANMYGELQGIMGKALPDIKQLSLPDGESEASEETV